MAMRPAGETEICPTRSPNSSVSNPDSLNATELGFAMLQVDRKTYSRMLASAILPGDRFTIPEESTGWTAVRKSRNPHDRVGSLLNRTASAAATHCCLYPSRID